MKKNIFHIYLLFFFTLLVFLSTFLTIHINGDDIDHMSGNYNYVYRYKPILAESWIPNRVMDPFGRTVFAKFFDLFYAFSNKVLKLDFFVSYKVFASIVSSVFFFLFSRFLVKLIFNFKYKISNYIFLLYFLFIFTFYVEHFYLRNIYHFFAVQIPAIIGCLYLWKIYNYFEDFNKHGFDFQKLFFVIFLSYIVNFTIEVFTLSYLLIGIFIIFYQFEKQDFLKINFFFKKLFNTVFLIKNLPIFVSIFFSLVSLILVALFSKRIGLFEKSFPIFLLDKYDFYLNQFKYFFFSSQFKQLVIFTSCLFLFKNFRKTFLKNDTKFSYFIFYTFVCSYIAAFIAQSFDGRTDFNFYNWGDLYLLSISLFFILAMRCSINFLYIKYNKFNFFYILIKLLILIYLFIYLSQAILRYADKVIIKFDYDKKVEKCFIDYLNNKKCEELNIEKIPMSIKPYPDNTTPEWFNTGYNMLIKKYRLNEIYNLNLNSN